jgi:hypothetical protein
VFSSIISMEILDICVDILFDIMMKSLQTVVSGECGKCSMVSTKYGNVCTDHILFICSGAFHSCKPSDMLAELQGRLPIRVELKGLTQEVNLCLYEFSFSSHRIQLH